MFSNKIRIAIVALASAATLALPASAFAQNPLEWSLTGGASEQPYDFNTYTLGDAHRAVYCPNRVNPSIGCWQDLMYGHETFGVDLTWNNLRFDQIGNSLHEGDAQWKFVRAGKHLVSCHQISGTENVALYNTKNHRFLADGGSYTFGGVHVQWVTTPRYEWKVAVGLLEQPTYSARVAQLYDINEPGPGGTRGAYLVAGHQTWGVDLRWLHAPYGLPYTYNPPAPCRLGPTPVPARLAF